MSARQPVEIPLQSVPNERPIGTKVVYNVLSGLVRLVVIAPVPFLLTPFLLRHLGTQGFGAWAVFLSINSLTSLADIGVMGTLTKHVSEHYTRQDYANLNRIVNAGVLVFLAIALLAVVLSNLAAGFVVSAFFRNVPASRMPLEYLFRLLTISIALNLLTYPFSSVISGLQRLDIVNGLWALNTILTASGVALFVMLGLGIEGLVFAIVLTSVTLFSLTVAVARHLVPELRLELTSVHWGDIKALASFSTQIYVTQIATAVYIHTEKLLLAHFAGLTPAGWYDIANDLAMKIRNVPALLITPVMPAASELHARQDFARSEQLYYRAQKYLAFVGMGIFTIVAVTANRFVELWLGPGFTGTARALIVLTGVQIGNLVGAPALLILIGRGILRPAVRFALVGMTGTLVVSTILISLFGFTGALYGTSFSILGAAGYLIFLFHRETGYATGPLLKIYVKPVLSGAFLAFFMRMLPLFRFGGWDLIVISLLALAAYSLMIVFLRYFDRIDLEVVERFIRIPAAVRKTSLFS